MKKFFFCKVLLILAAAILSCGRTVQPETSLPENMPDDFDIVFEDWIAESNKNIFDTYEGCIQKDLVTAGTARAEFTPSAELKSEIYSMVRECALDKIKRNLTSAELAAGSKEIIYVEPCTYYRVQFTANGKTYTAQGDYTMREYIFGEDDAANFWNFIQFIRELYTSTDEYKSLPEPEGGYE